MRAGAVVSVIGHIGLLAFLLFSAPRPFDSVPAQTVEVEIVPAKDEPQAEPEKSPEPEPKPQLTLPSLESTPTQPTTQNGQAPASAQPQQPAPQKQQHQQQQAQQQQPPQSQQQASRPPAPQQPPPAAQQPPPDAQPAPSAFDPASIPSLMDIAPTAQAMPTVGFDAMADVSAKLSRDDVTQLKDQLRRCWKLPPSVSTMSRSNVVVRVFLKRDGALAAEPEMIAASGVSRDGPAIVQTALRAIKQCQPYAALPADRYDEWKILDISFSPREMAGS